MSPEGLRIPGVEICLPATLAELSFSTPSWYSNFTSAEDHIQMSSSYDSTDTDHKDWRGLDLSGQCFFSSFSSLLSTDTNQSSSQREWSEITSCARHPNSVNNAVSVEQEAQLSLIVTSQQYVCSFGELRSAPRAFIVDVSFSTPNVIISLRYKSI